MRLWIRCACLRRSGLEFLLRLDSLQNFWTFQMNGQHLFAKIRSLFISCILYFLWRHSFVSADIRAVRYFFFWCHVWWRIWLRFCAARCFPGWKSGCPAEQVKEMAWESKNRRWWGCAWKQDVWGNKDQMWEHLVLIFLENMRRDWDFSGVKNRVGGCRKLTERWRCGGKKGGL